MSCVGTDQWNNQQFIRSLVGDIMEISPGLSTKGHIGCPACDGTLLWVRDYQGMVYVSCVECKNDGRPVGSESGKRPSA